MRLIDIEPFETEKNVVRCEIYRHFISETYGAVQTMSTASVPTIDAVPVVRCKDCRMFVDNKEAFVTYCRRSLKNITVNPDDFCSYGERRTDNG